MYPESDELNDYLVSDAIVDWRTPAVLQKALELTQSLSDEVAKACCLYEWVRDNISLPGDAGLDPVTCSADELLRQGSGICFAKSHLLAALLRAVNIPAGFCYQVVRFEPPVDNEPVLHGFNGIYLATLNRWIRVDARGNSSGVNAQFNTGKEQLAFAMDPLADEFIYEAIFAAPVAGVVSRLKLCKNIRDLWQDPPQSL